MEATSSKTKRVFRNEAGIRKLLEEQSNSGLNIKAFCEANQIPQGSFHNWKKKYQHNNHIGFTSIDISTALSNALFAEVGQIKLYQPVSAAYLKELIA